MPLGTPVLANQDHVDHVVRPAQIPNPWVTIIDATGMDDADASPIVNPDGEITAATRHIFKIQKKGTTLRLRMAYDDGDTSTQAAVIVVFGRYNSDDAWQELTNKSANTSVTLGYDNTNDVTDGTYKYTDVDPNDHAWDLDGCDEILVGVETVYAGTDATLAFLQAKVI